MLGDGSHILFWTNDWVPDIGPLLDLATDSLDGHDLKLNFCYRN